ncbi:MAG: hypothetical protein B7Z73_18915, partial [Planctomycetia bacterium 21-64-5]
GKALEDPQSLARLVPQVAVARQASQQEPRLSACYQFVDLGTFKFLVVEDLHGDPLEERLKQPGARFSVSMACRLVRLAALGLARLHSLGQAHGHVRPANVWLEESGATKLLQFPLIGDPLSPRLPPASIEAQLDYLAPELFSPAALADARSDVYSLGCLLFTLLAGKPPLAGGDRQSKLARQTQEAPPAIAKFNPETPAALAQVLNYLLQKDPARRYPDAAAVAEVLQAYSGGDPQTAPQGTLAAYEAWLQQPQRGPAPVNAPQAAAPQAAPPLAARPIMAGVPTAGANGGGMTGRMPAAPLVQPVPAGVAMAAAPLAGHVQPARAAYPASPAVPPPVVHVAPAVVAAPSGAAAIAQRRAKKGGQTAA